MIFMGMQLPNFSPVGMQGKKSAKYLNNIQVMDIFNRLTNIALSRFKWINLPPSCNERVLELTLYFYGWALFFRDEDLGFLHTPCNLPGPFNVYWESINRHAYSFEYHKDYTIADSVLIRNNKTMAPDYLTVWNYTPKIADTLRAIDVQTQTLKRPFMITCNEKERESIRNMLMNIADNEIAVVGQKGQNVDPIQVLSFEAKSNLTEMWATCKNYFNQIFNSLGVKNNFTEKRERMITSEVEGEGNSIRHTLESCLQMRQEACEQINSMFGLNVQVEANEIETFTDEFIEMMQAKVAGKGPADVEEEEEVTEE